VGFLYLFCSFIPALFVISAEKTHFKIMEHGVVEIKRIFPAITPATELPLMMMAMVKAVKNRRLFPTY
jgi:hypothetical protein